MEKEIINKEDISKEIENNKLAIEMTKSNILIKIIGYLSILVVSSGLPALHLVSHDLMIPLFMLNSILWAAIGTYYHGLLLNNFNIIKDLKKENVELENKISEKANDVNQMDITNELTSSDIYNGFENELNITKNTSIKELRELRFYLLNSNSNQDDINKTLVYKK